MPTIPTTMHAAAIDEFGGPEVLKLHRLPVPAPAAGEVLMRIDTAGVGSWDAEIRGGWSPGDQAMRSTISALSSYNLMTVTRG